MNRSRRVGGLTAGVSLVAFGVCFAVGMFVPDFNFWNIISFWPAVFILLGSEILFNYFTAGDEKAGYDFLSVFIIFIMLFFALTMAGAQILIEHYNMVI